MTSRAKRLVLVTSLMLMCSRIALPAQEPRALSTEALHDRGVLFYVPFEDTTKARAAVGQPEPWVSRDVLFTDGVHGRAVQLLHKPSRYVMMPDGRSSKYKNMQSMLVYEALGNVYRRRGTLAFWVMSPWDASNKDLLTGSTMTGPSVIGISSRDVYTAFLTIVRRKSFFEFRFGGRYRAGPLKAFRTFGHKLIPRWKANHWHHVAVTWDDRSGFAVYHNGELIARYEGEIAWDLYRPDTIALGSRPLAARDLWPTYHDYAFDELMVFSRPLSAAEVARVRDADYAAIRPVEDSDWPFDAQGRRRQTGLAPVPGRPVFVADAEKGIVATIRRCTVDEVDLKYHRRWTLVDGNDTSFVQFKDGGVLFDVPARFRFSAPSMVNHVVTVMDNPAGSYLFDGTPEKRTAEIPAGRNHLSLPPRSREELGVFFRGNSVGREFGFFLIRPDAGEVPGGTRYRVAGTIPAGRYGDAAQVLLQTPHPGDGPAFYATASGADVAHQFERGALHSTYVVLEATDKDRYVESLRVRLPILPAKQDFNALVRVHDPLIAGRMALDMDLAVRWPKTDSPAPLDLRLGPTGLIIPAGGHLVVELVLDTEWTLFCGGKVDAFVQVIESRGPKAVGRAFAKAQLRKMWPSFLRRLNQNRFFQRGETQDSNPIWRGLALAEKYDPENEQVKAWFGWSRLRPWPVYDFGYLEKQPGPQWAVYLREGVLSMQTVIHWWLDNRANKDAYLVGAGNQWNDITKLYNKYLCLGALAGDKRLVDAVERYLDAHWNTGRMIRGYTYSLTDMTHSAEEASFIQPCLHVLRPGVPRHVYRDLLTASNYSKWIGTNKYGHTHFRSNYVTAKRMLTEGVHGRDFVGCETPTVPGRFLAGYNGHPPTAAILTAHAKSWLDDTLREGKDKPAGVVPWAVQFETDKLYDYSGNKTLMYDQFLWAHVVTGDAAFLKPVRMLLEQKSAFGGLKWALTYSRNYVQYRILTNDSGFDRQLVEMSDERYESFQADGFFQRGIESAETQGLFRWVVEPRKNDLLEMLKFVIRNNRRSFHPYTLTDPPTDRVYPWGRVILPVVMLGGRLFDGRAADPHPSAAFVWEDIDTDIVSMVFERRPTSLKMLVYNFKETPVDAGLRALQLPMGRYRLSTSVDKDGDWKPDAAPSTNEIEFRRFTPTPVTVPARTPLWISLELIARRPVRSRPDLAVALARPAGGDGKVVARLHNLGCAPAEKVVVHLTDGKGVVLGTAEIAKLPALLAYAPQFVEITLALPAGTDPSECRMVVDPDNRVEEINESNNVYPLQRGVPPPVEKKQK